MTDPEGEQSVQLWLSLSSAWGEPDEIAAIRRFEEGLQSFVAREGLGEFDGNEVGMGYYTLYLDGPDAEALADAVVPLARGAGVVRPGSYALVRAGGPDSPSRRIAL